jgi:D-sedoheptulose 7-phosphate isomerase
MANFFYNVEEYNQVAQRLYDIKFQDKVEASARELAMCIKNCGTIYIAGNGGSASDASHFAGEIVGRFYKERKGLACVALNTDMAGITAIGNDYGFDAIYERQLEALFNPEKDIFIGITTSGFSSNVIRALEYVSEKGGHAINLLGKTGGAVTAFEEFTNIIVPSNDTPRIQEIHMFILHYWAEFIEEEFVNGL